MNFKTETERHPDEATTFEFVVNHKAEKKSYLTALPALLLFLSQPGGKD